MAQRASFSASRARRGDSLKTQKESYPEIVKKVISQSDIILQVMDIRFLKDTRNKELEKEIKSHGKKIIFVINKIDTVNEKDIDKKDLSRLYPYVLVSCTLRKGIKKLRERIKILATRLKGRAQKYGRINVGVIGYPNTGKSSLINLLTGKSSAKTGAEAGFTKGMQKLRLSSGITLLDSPGTISAGEYSEFKKDAIANYVKVGARSYSQTKDPEMAVMNIMKEFPGVLEKFYNIDAQGNSEALIEELGRKKGFLKKANQVDEDRIARYILREWQEGKIRFHKEPNLK